MSWNVYNIILNKNTHNWGGIEWVVDGEYGRNTYPGFLSKEEARRLYQEGKLFSVDEERMYRK